MKVTRLEITKLACICLIAFMCIDAVAQETGTIITFNNDSVTKVDEVPFFPSEGEVSLTQFIRTKMIYPRKLLIKRVKGKVVCSFKIDSLGKVSDPVILQSFHPELDKEALRIINSMPAWTPAVLDNRPVPYQYTLTIHFDPKDYRQCREEKEDWEEKEKEGKLWVIYERQPEYPGGINALKEFISQHAQYPQELANSGIQGKIICQFTVNSQGFVEDARIIRGLHPTLDQEALRVVNLLPHWKPGALYKAEKGHWEFVKTRYSLPLNFVPDQKTTLAPK